MVMVRDAFKLDIFSGHLFIFWLLRGIRGRQNAVWVVPGSRRTSAAPLGSLRAA
jgi:hypothetical protein